VPARRLGSFTKLGGHHFRVAGKNYQMPAPPLGIRELDDSNSPPRWRPLLCRTIVTQQLLQSCHVRRAHAAMSLSVSLRTCRFDLQPWPRASERAREARGFLAIVREVIDTHNVVHSGTVPSFPPYARNSKAALPASTCPQHLRAACHQTSLFSPLKNDFKPYHSEKQLHIKFVAALRGSPKQNCLLK
jgi:hypothetical protein